jgi:hypothetical protein
MKILLNASFLKGHERGFNTVTSFLIKGGEDHD